MAYILPQTTDRWKLMTYTARAMNDNGFRYEVDKMYSEAYQHKDNVVPICTKYLNMVNEKVWQ